MSQQKNIPPPSLDSISNKNNNKNDIHSPTKRTVVDTASVFESYTVPKRYRSENEIIGPVMTQEEWMHAHSQKRTKSDLLNEYRKTDEEIKAEFEEKTELVREAFQYFARYKKFDDLPGEYNNSQSSGSLEVKLSLPTNSSNEGEQHLPVPSDSSSLDSGSGSFVSTGEAAYTRALATTEVIMETRPIIQEFTSPPPNLEPILFSDTTNTGSGEKTSSSQEEEGTTSNPPSQQHEEEEEEQDGFDIPDEFSISVIEEKVITKEEKKKTAAGTDDEGEAEVEETKISEKKTTTTTTTTTTIEKENSQ